MLDQERTATTSTTATAIVQVDPVTVDHLRLHPILATVAAAYVIAVYRDSRLVDVDAFTAPDASGIPFLRQRARMVAGHLGGAYLEPCRYCGIACAPADRFDHNRMVRGSETSWRAA